MFSLQILRHLGTPYHNSSYLFKKVKVSRMTFTLFCSTKIIDIDFLGQKWKKRAEEGRRQRSVQVGFMLQRNRKAYLSNLSFPL
jgi:hypothetical protein